MNDNLTVSASREGGFGAFPGLAEPVTVDASQLQPEDADRLEKVVAESGFFEIPEPLGRGESMRDARTYTITVSKGEHRRTLTAPEPLPGGLRELVNEVEQYRGA
jgi:hypothetical protein